MTKTLSQVAQELIDSGRWDRVDSKLISGTPETVLTFQLELRKYHPTGTDDDPRRRIEHHSVRVEVTGRDQSLTEKPTESAVVVTDETQAPPDGEPWRPALEAALSNGQALGILWANVGKQGGFAKMLVPGVGGAPKVEIWGVYFDEQWHAVPMNPQPPTGPL